MGELKNLDFSGCQTILFKRSHYDKKENSQKRQKIREKLMAIISNSLTTLFLLGYCFCFVGN